MNVWLDYDPKLRERAPRIMLGFGYENPRFPPAEHTPEPPPATPASFVFPNGARMGMDRDKVKALHTGRPRTDRGNTLAYQTKLFDMDMDARITYTFDQQGKLASIAARFTKTPYDPSYYIGNFDRVSYFCTYKHYGLPKEEQPMIWAAEHTFDPRDGSKWITAVQRGALIYRHTWVAGDVTVTHELKGEKGVVSHTLMAY